MNVEKQCNSSKLYHTSVCSLEIAGELNFGQGILNPDLLLRSFAGLT
jgi:hypothetical protein